MFFFFFFNFIYNRSSYIPSNTFVNFKDNPDVRVFFPSSSSTDLDLDRPIQPACYCNNYTLQVKTQSVFQDYVIYNCLMTSIIKLVINPAATKAHRIILKVT